MKHYDWIPTDPASQRKVDLDGYLDVAPQQAFSDDVHQMVRQVRALQLDPMYLLNGDLPVEADTEAEKAEISKQLRKLLKSREDLRKIGAFANVPKQKRFKNAARRLL
jgi:5,10-methylenetetrahydrofolate reductase